jgi:adenine/guanine/hypoxanthine permease
MLDSFFKLKENGTTVRTEIVAGCTTFLTMAYIMFVNPLILSDAGMDRGAVFVATCLGTAIGTLAMGLYANYPLALAPGMGLNAYFTYGVVKGMHYSWEVALGAVLISGILFLILSLLRLREWVVDTIPPSLKMAISAGIGLFLGIIALKNAGIIAGSPDTLVTLGDVKAPSALLAIAGFLVIVALDARRVPGAIIIAVLGATAVGVALGVSPFGGIASAPPSLAPTFLKLDLAGALNAGIITIVFAFFFVDLFDNTGTLVGVVVAVLFLLSLFLAPLAGTVAAYATAPALLYVACLMTRGLAEVDWEDATEYAPAVITAIAMPLTFSIANGIAFGFITYAAVKLLAGRTRDVSPALATLALLFLVKFAVL